MLPRIAILFLIMALLAGLFGFGLIESIYAGEARIVFFVLLGLAVVSFLAAVLRKRNSSE